jgi:CheY-like chemotaxis protein
MPDRERLLEEGFDGYVSKPLDTRTFGPYVESLVRAIRRGGENS